MNLREALASTAYASLEWDENREKAVDRVAASGKAPPLGLAIWKTRYMLEVSAYRAAVIGLQAHYLSRYRNESPEIALKCVEQALGEYLGPQCPTCSGTRETMAAGLKVLCPGCGGSGLKRFRDSERAGRMKLSQAQVRVLAHKLQWLQGQIGELDRQVNSVIAMELERG